MCVYVDGSYKLLMLMLHIKFMWMH